MTQQITYERTGSIATITLDDGKVNAITPSMLEALDDALDEAQWDQAVVVLVGRAGVFSAGFDLSLLRRSNADATLMVSGGFELVTRLFCFPCPIVIACTGHALAMGAFLLLAGDYRIGTEGRFKIGVDEVRIGIPMPRFGAELCRHRLSPTHFSRAVLNAEIYSPCDAVAAGFLDSTTSEADVLSTAHLVATRLSALNMRAYATTKARVREPIARALRHAITLDRADVATSLAAGHARIELSTC